MNVPLAVHNLKSSQHLHKDHQCGLEGESFAAKYKQILKARSQQTCRHISELVFYRDTMLDQLRKSCVSVLTQSTHNLDLF